MTETEQYARMADAIAFLTENWRDRPDLATAAARAGLSPWHFQRAFSRWVGVSPKRFQGLLALDHARGLLQRGAPVLDAALDSGFSGTSRLHDLAVTFDALSPGELARGGEGLTFTYGIADSLLGRIFVVSSPRGITRLAFVEPGDEDSLLAHEKSAWPEATFITDNDTAADIARRLFDSRGFDSQELHSQDKDKPLRLAPRGTNFQIKVWQALLAIPPGSLATYAAIAKALGSPGASRAVGSACGANPVAVLIPCHRVLRGTGALGGYAFGLARKRALIAMEAGKAGVGETLDA